MAPIKQLVVLRRKAGLSKQEFFDYHYQKHGAMSTGPVPEETPTKYFQTHFIDAAYHADTSRNVPNAHPHWAFSDGATELYFDSSEHMQTVFASKWVAGKVGPDGANFSDFSAVIPSFVKEESISLAVHDEYKDTGLVGMYFVSLNNKVADTEHLISNSKSRVVLLHDSCCGQEVHRALSRLEYGPAVGGFKPSQKYRSPHPTPLLLTPQKP